MMESKFPKRFPGIQCWIKDILEGVFSTEENILFSKYGKIKRIKIVATIIDKGIFPKSDSDEFRIVLTLDDSTGLIRAVAWGEPDAYEDYKVGDIVELVGIIPKTWNDYHSLKPEIIKKVDEPNLILLRNAEIINRIKFGEIEEIPVLHNGGNDIEEFSDEIDVTTIFESEDHTTKHDEIKEKIYLIVEEYSTRGNGISFEKLKQEVKISEKDLRKHTNNLILESRIYKSDKDNFEAF
jgi:RPA family protein